MEWSRHSTPVATTPLLPWLGAEYLSSPDGGKYVYTCCLPAAVRYLISWWFVSFRLMIHVYQWHVTRARTAAGIFVITHVAGEENPTEGSGVLHTCTGEAVTILSWHIMPPRHRPGLFIFLPAAWWHQSIHPQIHLTGGGGGGAPASLPRAGAGWLHTHENLWTGPPPCMAGRNLVFGGHGRGPGVSLACVDLWKGAVMMRGSLSGREILSPESHKWWLFIIVSLLTFPHTTPEEGELGRPIYIDTVLYYTVARSSKLQCVVWKERKLSAQSDFSHTPTTYT